jgi:hypothetical protein
VHGSEYRGIAHGAVVHCHAIHNRHRVEKTAGLNLANDGLVLGRNRSGSDVVVEDCCIVPVAPLNLCPDDRGDLLRRPRGASTARETVRGSGYIEHFNDNLAAHPGLHIYRIRTAPPAHTLAQTPQPAHLSSIIRYPFAPG